MANHRLWTRDTILAAIRAWAEFHGRPPRFRDLNSSGGQLPHTKAVYREFPDEGWRGAVIAAGVTPCELPKGRKPKPREVPKLEVRCACGEPLYDESMGTMCGFCVEEAEYGLRVAA